MREPVKALLLDASNPAAEALKGQMGYLYCQVGLRCLFEGMLTSIVNGVVWFGSRVEVYTQNSRYIFELQERGHRPIELDASWMLAETN
jgi:hypothetical protein